MKNLEVLYLTSKSIQQCRQKQANSSPRETKTNKLNENILIAKTLEAFNPTA